MLKNNRMKLALLALMIGLLVSTAGCAGAVSQAQPQVVYPTVVIVQYVTQVVATVTPAPPVVAAAKPEQPRVTQAVSSNVGYDGLREEVYYPIMGCQVASRLHVGEKAYVANGAGEVGLYQSMDIGFAPEWRKLDAGEVVDIVGGPWCERGALVWQVIASDERVGFSAEGDGNEYWLLPTGDKVTKEALKTGRQVMKERLGLPANCLPR